MKRVIVKNGQGQKTNEAEIENPTHWIAENISNNSWGLPERWKRKKESTPEEIASALETKTIIHSEATPEVKDIEYTLPDGTKVLKTQATQEQITSAVSQKEIVVIPAQPAITHEEVRLPAQYTVEIVDLTKDPVWLEEQIKTKREQEYPSVQECVEAMLESLTENRPEKLNEIKAKRAAVKAKYPKPGQGGQSGSQGGLSGGVNVKVVL